MSGSVEAGHQGRPRRAWPSWTRGLAAGLAVTVACADLFGPDRIVTPRLRTLLIDDLATSLRHGGILYINGYPADTSFRLESGQRVLVEIAVSSGDRERAGLYRKTCPPRERRPYFNCFEFDVGMRAGFNAVDLADHVAAMGGRFFIVSVDGSFAGVTLFDPDDLVSRARRARSWPGVAYTELTNYFCAPDTPGCFSLSNLTVPVPVDTGAAVPGDGIVQVRSGDTVAVSYKQPDGLTLQARRPVP